MIPYRICTRCVMDTTDPDITFDEHGHCNHCRHFFEKIWMREWLPTAKGRELLDEKLEQIRESGRAKQYDCVLGLSGGVDSSYMAWLAVKEFGLRPLVVHVDAGWNAEIAVGNIHRIVSRLGLDLHTEVIHWPTMRDLQVSFFRAGLANQDVPQDHAFTAGVYGAAARFGIHTILGGSNYATESILPSAWAYNAMDRRHLMGVHRLFGQRSLERFPTLNFFQYYAWYPFIRRIRVLKPLNYLPYVKKDAMALLQRELGWRDYGGKHFESRFTKFQQAYYRPMKFGYDERRAYLSSLIVSGESTREAALAELERPVYTDHTLALEKDFVRRKLGLSETEFDKILQGPPHTFHEYPSNAGLFALKDRVVAQLRRAGILSPATS